MRLHAFINNNTVVKIESITEDVWKSEINNYQLILDIEDFDNKPEVGYIITSSYEFQPSSPLSSEKQFKIQQTAQRIFGLKLLTEITDIVGARNLLFSSQGNNVDVSSLLQSLGIAKSLLETGALKTARGFIFSVKNSHPAYADILDTAIGKITIFLTENNYE